MQPGGLPISSSFDTIISFKAPKLMCLRSFETNWQQPYRLSLSLSLSTLV